MDSGKMRKMMRNVTFKTSTLKEENKNEDEEEEIHNFNRKKSIKEDIPLYLIKETMTEDEENFHEYFKEDDETFLMKYNFAPSGCKILNIFCTKTNTFLLSKTGKVFSWGKSVSCLGRECNNPENARFPGEITSFPSKILTLATGANHVLALDFEGKIYSWGDNSYGQLGNPFDRKGKQIANLAKPQEIPFFLGMKLIAIFAGEDVSYAINEKGVLFGWGNNIFGQVQDNEKKEMIFKSPVAFKNGPWDNNQTIIKVGRTQHKYFFNNSEKFPQVTSNLESLGNLSKLETQISHLKEKISNLEKVNESYQEKIYGKFSYKLAELQKKYNDDEIILEMSLNLENLKQTKEKLESKNNEIDTELKQANYQLTETHNQKSILLEKETKQAELFDEINKKILKVKASKASDIQESLFDLEEKKTKLYEMIKVNGNLKTAIARKLAEIEEYQKNLRDQKNQNIKELAETEKKIDLNSIFMFERKESLLKKFFITNDNIFFLTFRRFYGFLHLLKETKINELAKKYQKSKGLLDLVYESNEQLEEVKKKIEQARNNHEDNSYDFYSKLAEIFEDNINLRRTINELTVALLLNTSNKIEEFYKENKFSAPSKPDSSHLLAEQKKKVQEKIESIKNKKKQN